jgi:membrane-bound lytic murein transglycosylase B
MFKIFLMLFSTTLLFADLNCKFENQNYVEICKRYVQNGVSYEYANSFLLSSLKTQKFDEISFEYLQPKHIKTHKKNEKKANNVLIKFIPEVVEHLKTYSEVYDYTEEKYGVNREIVAAILLKETKLGKIVPKHDAFIVFNTLVVRTKPNSQREKWLLNMGKTNMVSIITYCYNRDITPNECNLPSSYAGAIGIPQFMPESFSFAEGYKTEFADLTKMEDAIVSAAKFLYTKAEFKELIDWDKIPDIADLESKWYDFEFENEDASFVHAKNKNGDKEYKCFTCDKKELDYLREYTKKILRYNNSSNYAVGVMRLAYEAQKGLKQEQ